MENNNQNMLAIYNNANAVILAIDHIIVGVDRYVSMAEKGLMAY